MWHTFKIEDTSVADMKLQVRPLCDFLTDLVEGANYKMKLEVI